MSSGTQTNLMDSDISQRHLTAESVVLKPSLALCVTVLKQGIKQAICDSRMDVLYNMAMIINYKSFIAAKN